MNKTLGLLTIAVAALLPPSAGMAGEVVRWEATLESAQRLAAQSNRLVLIYFSGPSCIYCRRMEAEVLGQPGVAAVISADYVPVKIVADYFPTTAKRYNVTHLPTTVIVTPQGEWLNSKEGYVAANDYVNLLGSVAVDAKRRSRAVVAQAPNGSMPPVNPPVQNQPTTNGPLVSHPQPSVPLPYGAPPTTSVSPGQGVSAPVSPRYGGLPNTAFSPPAVPQAPVTQQQYPPIQQQQPPVTSQQYPPVQQPPVVTPPQYPPVQQQPPVTQQYPPMQQQQPPVTRQYPPMQQQQPPVLPQNTTVPPQGNVVPPTVPGNPPVGLDGCCPVSLAEKAKWVAGDRRWGVNHRGRLYFFAGPEEQGRFFADPDRYAPAVSGNDVVLVSEGQVVAGRREFGVYYRNRVYLFSSEATRAKFEANPAPYADQALQALRAGAYHPTGQWR